MGLYKSKEGGWCTFVTRLYLSNKAMSESDAENLNDYSLTERISSNRANFRIHAYLELEASSVEEHVEFYNLLWVESSGFEGLWLNERGKAALQQAASTLHIILKSLSEQSQDIIGDFFETYLLNLLKNCTILNETSTTTTTVKRSPQTAESKVDSFLIYLTTNGNVLRNFIVTLSSLKDYQDEKSGLYPIKGPGVKQVLRVITFINDHMLFPSEEEYANREDYESINASEILGHLGKLFLIGDAAVRSRAKEVIYKMIKNRIVTFSEVDTSMRNVATKDNRTKNLILDTISELRSVDAPKGGSGRGVVLKRKGPTRPTPGTSTRRLNDQKPTTNGGLDANRNIYIDHPQQRLDLEGYDPRDEDLINDSMIDGSRDDRVDQQQQGKKRTTASNNRDRKFSGGYDNQMRKPPAARPTAKSSFNSSSCNPIIRHNRPIHAEMITSKHYYMNTNNNKKNDNIYNNKSSIVPESSKERSFGNHQIPRKPSVNHQGHHHGASHPWRSAPITNRYDDGPGALTGLGQGVRHDMLYQTSNSNGKQYLEQNLSRRKNNGMANTSSTSTMMASASMPSCIRWNIVDLYSTKRNDIEQFQILCTNPSKLKESVRLFLAEQLIRSSNLFGVAAVDGWKKKELLQSVLTNIERDPVRAFRCSRFIESFIALILWILNGTKVTNIISGCIQSLGSLSSILLKADLKGWSDDILYGVGTSLSQKMLQFSKVNNTSTNVILNECINSVVCIAEASDNVNTLILSLHHYLKEVEVNRKMDHAFIISLFSLMTNFVDDDVIKRYMEGQRNQEIVYSDLNMIAKFMEDPLPQSVSMQALDYLYRIFTIFDEAHNSYFVHHLRLFEDGALLEFCLNFGSAHGITHSIENADELHQDLHMDDQVYDTSSYILDPMIASEDDEFQCPTQSANQRKLDDTTTNSLSTNEHYFGTLPPPNPTDHQQTQILVPIAVARSQISPIAKSPFPSQLNGEREYKIDVADCSTSDQCNSTIGCDLIEELRIIECIRCLELLKLLWQNYPQAIKKSPESINYVISWFESNQEISTMELVNKWEPSESEELLSDLLMAIEKSCEKLLKAKSKTSKSKFLESFLANFLEIEKLAVRLLNRINT